MWGSVLYKYGVGADSYFLFHFPLLGDVFIGVL